MAEPEAATPPTVGPVADTCTARARAVLLAGLGVHLDEPLITTALTHRSYAYEHGGLPTNERLEFLGDAVLGVAVTEMLYRRFPDEPEGSLAKRRASLVNARTLAAVAADVRLGEAMLLGRGEEITGGRNKASILADGLEAVIGAVYLQHRLEGAASVVLRLLEPRLESPAAIRAGQDYKTSLQELASELGRAAPVYRVDGDGPDHARTFQATVLLDGSPAGSGTGRSKKEAEQRAAEHACRVLQTPTQGQLQTGSSWAEHPAEHDG